MRKPLTLTELAIVKLNHIALTMHYREFRWRLNRLVNRMTGNRKYQVCTVCILEVVNVLG